MKDYFIWLGTVVPVSIAAMIVGGFDFNGLTNFFIGGVAGLISMLMYSLRD